MGSNLFILCVALVFGLATAPVFSAVPKNAAVMVSLASGGAQSKAVRAYYKETQGQMIWLNNAAPSKKRLRAFVKAIEDAPTHGLDPAKYPVQAIIDQLGRRAPAEQVAAAEGQISELFVEFCRDMQTGILTPSRVSPDTKRKAPLRDPKSYLEAYVKSTPNAFFKSLAPQTDRYKDLVAAKARFETLIKRGGWGAQVASGPTMRPGEAGARIADLRKRLGRMGYLKGANGKSYDAKLQKAVQLFQQDHAMNRDGVVGPATLAAINVQAEARLKSIIVAMERERWLNKPLGARYVEVNIPDYHARIINNGRVEFETRAVVGADKDDQRSPEFSDMIEHMVVNPSWNVPYSIAVKEYLPQLQQDPNAVGHLTLLDDAGALVDRTSVDFTTLDEGNFPFRLKQFPSEGNALGNVKFMFPNRYNIYLHDTPAKSLFSKDMRAHSHGCIRLADPAGFAHALLSVQSSDPEAVFANALGGTEENYINLKEHVPVHLIYRTAVPLDNGRIGFRTDIYERDAQIWQALAQEGVALKVATR